MLPVSESSHQIQKQLMKARWSALALTIVAFVATLFSVVFFKMTGCDNPYILTGAGLGVSALWLMSLYRCYHWKKHEKLSRGPPVSHPLGRVASAIPEDMSEPLFEYNPSRSSPEPSPAPQLHSVSQGSGSRSCAVPSPQTAPPPSSSLPSKPTHTPRPPDDHILHPPTPSLSSPPSSLPSSTPPQPPPIQASPISPQIHSPVDARTAPPSSSSSLLSEPTHTPRPPDDHILHPPTPSLSSLPSSLPSSTPPQPPPIQASPIPPQIHIHSSSSSSRSIVSGAHAPPIALPPPSVLQPQVAPQDHSRSAIEKLSIEQATKIAQTRTKYTHKFKDFKKRLEHIRRTFELEPRMMLTGSHSASYFDYFLDQITPNSLGAVSFDEELTEFQQSVQENEALDLDSINILFKDFFEIKEILKNYVDLINSIVVQKVQSCQTQPPTVYYGRSHRLARTL